MDKKIIKEIFCYKNEEYAAHHQSFFKTGKGEYGEGDLFIGVRGPSLREISKKYYKHTTLHNINNLITNPYHEVRACCLMIMVLKYKKASEKEKEGLFDIYTKNLNHINNWDLVDISAQYIVGPHVFGFDDFLFNLASSNHLWSQRVAMIATFYNIRQGEFSTTLRLAEYFLSHNHDLMHKASGWMLREMGKRDIKPLRNFLDKYSKSMPRTMLRYAIEKLPDEERKKYLQK